MIVVHGYRGPIEDPAEIVALAKRAAQATGAVVQLLRADRLFSPAHALRAAQLARDAFDRGRNLSRDPGLEIALYASGERQIARALRKVGLEASPQGHIAVVAMGERAGEAATQVGRDAGWTRDDAALQGGVEALRALGVTRMEMELVPQDLWEALALEKVALVGLHAPSGA